MLPFANLSNDPEQDYFADGIVEEIITALSRIRWLRVIARNSSATYKGQPVHVRRAGRELGVQYVVEGSVRKAGAQVRIAAQLLEADDASHLWADHFDGTLERVFEFQDRVAVGVAAAIEPALQAAEIRRANASATTDPTAYDLYLRALADFPTCARDNLGRGLALLDRAITLDPDYGPALALASVYRVELENHGWADDFEQNRAAAIALARRALRSGAEDLRPACG